MFLIAKITLLLSIAVAMAEPIAISSGSESSDEHMSDDCIVVGDTDAELVVGDTDTELSEAGESKAPQDDVMGVFDTSVVRVAALMGYRATMGIDVKIGIDLDWWHHRATLLNELKVRRPKALICAPPCTQFSQMLRLSTGRIPEHVLQERLQQAERLFDLAVLCCLLQHTEDRLFVLEQPVSASSWVRTEKLTQLPNVQFAMFHQCRYGLQSPSGEPLQKATLFLTNSRRTVLEFDGKTCQCTRPHKIVQGSELGQRMSTWAQNYPRLLSERLVQSML